MSCNWLNYFYIFDDIIFLFLGGKYPCRFWHRAAGVYCSISEDRRPKVSAEGSCSCLYAHDFFLFFLGVGGEGGVGDMCM